MRKNPDYRPEIKLYKSDKSYLIGLCALVLQHLELAPAEVEWFSCHMGRNVNVHKNSYRLHTSAVEITKVGKVLMTIDSGVVGHRKSPSQQKPATKVKAALLLALSVGQLLLLLCTSTMSKIYASVSGNRVEVLLLCLAILL